MADMQRGSSSQVERLAQDMQATALRLQEVTSNLQAYLREQTHIQEDVVEVRRLVLSINQLLQEGTGATPSILTRLYVIDKEIDSMKNAQVRARDWWFKLLATLASAAIIGFAGVMLMLYVSAKAPLPKP
jgi:hypothetical protein